MIVLKSPDGGDVDLVLRNNQIGGSGNDLAIDDIDFSLILLDTDGDEIPRYTRLPR